MSRMLQLAAAQLGPVGSGEDRASMVGRIIALLEEASSRGCRLVVFPELALTPFFPRRLIEDEAELEALFERAMPGPETAALFEAAARLGVAFYLGYAEETADGARYNTAVLADGGRIVGTYRKVHLPGNAAYDPALKLQHLEPFYFQPGDLGFPLFRALGTAVGLLICNDRRWPEPWRVLGLKGAELVCLGYNTPAILPDAPEQNGLRELHHLLPMQAAAYQNGLWVVAAAKAGIEDGCAMMGSSCVIAPTGEIVARAEGVGDELVVAEADLDLARTYKGFHDFARLRRPECYGPITDPRAT